MIKYAVKLLILLSIFVVGCQSSTTVNSGIQPGFEAVNPASIIAVPIFIRPDPSSEVSSVDLSLLITEKLIPKLENTIIETNFVHQPNINGYSFSAVKKAVEYKTAKKETVKGEVKKGIWDNLDSTMKDVADRFSSRDTKTRLLITPNCLARKNFVEFYSYCLASDPAWLAALNTLSAKVLNADSALITVVTDLQNKLVGKQYQITGGIAVLLVDTNNGKLIWGNYKKEVITNPIENKYF
ncbi:MAG: hypothetical protein V4591_10120, partial [Bdellovibrionota bacterium]